MLSEARIYVKIGSAVLLACFRSSAGWTPYNYPQRRDVQHWSLSSALSEFETSTSIPAAGIPRELDDLALFESLDCDEHDTTTIASEMERKRRVERVSIDPPIFILRNAMSLEECRHVRSVASSMEAQMEDGKTVSDTDDADPSSQEDHARKHSRVGWLDNDRQPIESIARRAHGVFLNDMPFHATRGIEPLQVVHYHQEGGEYVNHHDANGRLLTVLYYLNGVGATWFPLATAGEEDGGDIEIRNLLEARSASAGKSPGQNGVLVTCRKDGNEEGLETADNGRSIVARMNEGDAVAFYSYRVDGSMNWKAFHSGLPVTQDDLLLDRGEENNGGGKWIANHFYHFVPSHIPETPPPAQ